MTRAVRASQESAHPILRVDGLSKSFRAADGREVTAVKDISLTVAQGEMVVLLGPSGCGKTTLLRCIGGLESPDAGDIEINGKNVFSAGRNVNLPPERRALSMMFQSYALWPHMTAFENVAYPLKVRSVPADEMRNRVSDALAKVGVSDLAKEHPGTMSGGQQQRVALARALVANSGLILFDEPLSNIDAKVRQELRSELRAMQFELGVAGLYVTHDQSEAFVLADRIVVLKEGAIEQIGAPREIYHQPRSRYVGHFVGIANELRGTLTRVDGKNLSILTSLGEVDGIGELPGVGIGAGVALLFRPEVCRITSEAPARGGVNYWRGDVHGTTFAGSHVELEIRVGEETLRTWTDSTDATRAGDTVFVTVDPAHIQVLPLTTTTLLRPATEDDA